MGNCNFKRDYKSSRKRLVLTRSLEKFLQPERIEEILIFLEENKSEEGEKHHILPKCCSRILGENVDNSVENLITLSPKDHIKVHILYRNFCLPQFKKALNFAVFKICTCKRNQENLTEEDLEALEQARTQIQQSRRGKRRIKNSEGKLEWIGDEAIYSPYNNTKDLYKSRYYQHTPNGKKVGLACMKRYLESEKGLKTRQKYNETHKKEFKEYYDKYRETEKGKERCRKAQQKWDKSEKGKLSAKRYKQSEKGRKVTKRFWKKNGDRIKNQKCLYGEKEISHLSLANKLRNLGVEHPYIEAKKYLV